MPETQNGGNTDFSRFDRMTDHELEEILRLDAEHTTEETIDTEKLLYIMQVLTERRRKQKNPVKSSEEAFQSFQENYFSLDQEIKPVTADSPEIVPCKVQAKKRGWSHRSVAAAALIAVVLLTSITTYAFGFDILKRLAKWTQNVFHFDSVTDIESDDPTDRCPQPLDFLQEALMTYDIPTDIIPTWIPEGYKLYNIDVGETPKSRVVVGCYRNNQEKIIKIQIKAYNDVYTQQIEKSDNFFEVYQSNGREYYIFDNNGMYLAAWTDQNCDIYIAGELSIKQMHEMLDSIEKR